MTLLHNVLELIQLNLEFTLEYALLRQFHLVGQEMLLEGE